MSTTYWRRGAGVTTSRSAVSRVLAGRLLLFPVLGSFLLYFALFLLLRSPSFRLTGTATLVRWPELKRLSDLLTPRSLVRSNWLSEQAAVHEYLYLLVAAALVGFWLWALWLARPGARPLNLGWIIAPILLFSAPLVVLPGMFSGDLYLYAFYGRIIAHYGENPILVAPDQFPKDPTLRWVYWKWLPSSYGPVWLLYSAVLSGIAGTGLWANLFTYKAGVLLLHLLTVAVVWKLLRDTRPQLATWGAIFYGWNPLVLFETAGSAHNDVFVALFAALALLAVARKRWLPGVVFLVAAAMVKLMALIMLPVLVVAWLRTLPGARERLRAVALAAGTAAASGLAMYAPLWGGTALVDNIRDNPAAREYQNSLWELLVLRVLSPGHDPMMAVFSADLDRVRNALFVGVFAFLLWRIWRGMDVVDGLIWVWFAYLLFAAWIWPWYLLPVVPLAAARGWSRTTLVAVGLTLGGMLFWLGWPEPALPAAPWFFNYRSVLLFAPAILLALWPRRGRRTGGRDARVAA